jgi:hypothetical protein
MMRSKPKKTLEQRLKEMPSSRASSEPSFSIDKHIDRKTGSFVSEEQEATITETDITKIPELFNADSLDLMVRKGNNIHVITGIKKALFHSENLHLKEPNPNLRLVANVSGMKLYLRLDTLEFWLMIRFDSIRVIWVKLAGHDLETLECVNKLYQHNFNASEVPTNIWVGKTERRKIQALNDKIHSEKRSKI